MAIRYFLVIFHFYFLLSIFNVYVHSNNVTLGLQDLQSPITPINKYDNQSTTLNPNTTDIPNELTEHNNTLKSPKSINSPISAYFTKGAFLRTFTVISIFVAISLLFFAIKTCRKTNNKSRKYGIISAVDLEMEPLDADDEDDTLYDAHVMKHRLD